MMSEQPLEHLEREFFKNLKEITREKESLRYETFLIVGMDIHEIIYFVGGYFKDDMKNLDDFCWCKASQVFN